MIRINIEGTDAQDVLAKGHALFPVQPISGAVENFKRAADDDILRAAGYAPPASLGPENQTVGAKIVDGLKDAVAHAGGTLSQVVTSEAVEAPKRGRPRKQNAQPAVAENTGSTAAAPLPAAEPAATSAAVKAEGSSSATVAPSALTHDAVKAKLQEVMHAAKDQNIGMAAAYAIVKEYGYTHVRDIKPEHFAAIHAAAVAKLAEPVT